MTAFAHNVNLPPMPSEPPREVVAQPFNPRTNSFSPVVPDEESGELIDCHNCGGTGRVLLRVREVSRD